MDKKSSLIREIPSMIQQIYAYTKRKRSRFLDESTIERDLVNDARDTDTVKQITHNT
jgi:hypothetical protein